jgi:hypothetical protein
MLERFADRRADTARTAGDYRRACHCRSLVFLPNTPSFAEVRQCGFSHRTVF